MIYTISIIDCFWHVAFSLQCNEQIVHNFNCNFVAEVVVNKSLLIGYIELQTIGSKDKAMLVATFLLKLNNKV